MIVDPADFLKSELQLRNIYVLAAASFSVFFSVMHRQAKCEKKSKQKGVLLSYSQLKKQCSVDIPSLVDFFI